MAGVSTTKGESSKVDIELKSKFRALKWNDIDSKRTRRLYAVATSTTKGWSIRMRVQVEALKVNQNA